MCINTAAGGVARTIRSRDWKSSAANIFHKGDGFVVTAVIEYEI
jgi:hypothetical protein